MQELMSTTDLKNFNNKNIAELEGIISAIEGELINLKNAKHQMVEQAQQIIGYDSVETAHDGLISFWGNREKAQQQLTQVENRMGTLGTDISKAKTPPDTSKLMESGYKVGEAYVLVQESIEKCEKLIVHLKSLIAEKKCEASQPLAVKLGKDSPLNQKPISAPQPKENEQESEQGLSQGKK